LDIFFVGFYLFYTKHRAVAFEPPADVTGP
jgi:hypothetical protein